MESSKWTIDILCQKAISLLMELITTPSFSKNESATADRIKDFFSQNSIPFATAGNNVYVKNKFFDLSKQTLLLNSHHDTVQPNAKYIRDPFSPTQENGKLFGLGSNDAGGALTALIATFLFFYHQKTLKYNIVFVASAEEEISGIGGIEMVWPYLPKIDFAIVGEPTLMNVAIAEKGLMIMNCICHGVPGHAAREESDNAIYKAMKDVEWIKNFQFQKVSSTLGKIKMSVTIIHAGLAHNQVPAECAFTVDVRLTDAYTMEEVLDIVQQNISSIITVPSFRLKPSLIDADHPLVVASKKLGKTLYGSPTTSDQALIMVPSIKMGPGDSARSHTADEFIYLKEIKSGIEDYVRLIELL